MNWAFRTQPYGALSHPDAVSIENNSIAWWSSWDEGLNPGNGELMRSKSLRARLNGGLSDLGCTPLLPEESRQGEDHSTADFSRSR
jgi:hypothetical protein